MTDTLPPVETAPDPQQPLEPAPEPPSRRWMWTLGTVAVVVGIAGAGVALGHQTPPAAVQAAPLDQSGNPACDSSMVEVYPDARDGVAILVHAPGPAVVTVSVSGGIDRGGVLTQQVTRRAHGAQFDFPQATPVDRIGVMINRNLDVTSCYVPIPDALGHGY